MVMMRVWFIGLREHFGEIVGKNNMRTSFSPFRVFLFSQNSRVRFWGAPGARVDFLAVVEHRLIPARVRSEWSRLRSKGCHPLGLWHPRILLMLVMLGSSMRGAPLALPTFATAQFKRFFDCGRAVRCMLPSWFWTVRALSCLVRFPGC